MSLPSFLKINPFEHSKFLAKTQSFLQKLHGENESHPGSWKIIFSGSHFIFEYFLSFYDVPWIPIKGVHRPWFYPLRCFDPLALRRFLLYFGCLSPLFHLGLIKLWSEYLRLRTHSLKQQHFDSIQMKNIGLRTRAWLNQCVDQCVVLSAHSIHSN